MSKLETLHHLPWSIVGKRRCRVVHVAMTSEVSGWIADRIAAFPNEAPDLLRGHAADVVRYAALPLHVGWWEIIAITVTGEIISWSTDDELSGYSGVRPVEDRYIRLIALVDGSERYGQLKSLLPARTATAVDCHHLAHPAVASGRMLCPECFGLGWVEPADKAPDRPST